MSRSSDRSSPGGRRSWKQGTAARGYKPAQAPGKPAAKWILTLFLIVLVAAFAYWVWSKPRGDRHLFVTALWASDQLAVPPLMYAREDLDGLLQIGDVSEPVDASNEAQDEAQFDELVRRVAARARGPEELLLFYITAHGLADDEGAYLLCSDFNGSRQRGKYSVTRLLDEFTKSQAGIKLLILDVGRLQYDPRLGVIGNAFPDAVIQAVEQQKDERLWVLLGTGGAQGIAVSHAERRSIFGRAVAAGLGGEATRSGDRYGDRYVDLGELYEYVSAQCRSHLTDELPDFQNPLLLRGGQGLIAAEEIPRDETTRLLFITPPEPGDEAPEATPPDKSAAEPAAKSQASSFRVRAMPLAVFQPAPGSTSASAPPAGQSAAGSSAAATSSEPASPAAPSTNPATVPGAKAGGEAGPGPAAVPPALPASAAGAANATSPPAAAVPTEPLTVPQQIRAELARLWDLRDRLRERQAAELSPIDFAPHIWREAEAWLVYYEQRARAGRAMNSARLGDAQDQREMETRLRDMRQLADELDRLIDAMNGGTISASRDLKSVGDRLLSAWQRYEREQKKADQRFDEEADELLRKTRDAARGLADQIYNASYLVRWFGHSAPTFADATRYQRRLTGYLDELHAAAESLQQLEKSPVSSAEQSRLQTFINRQVQLTARERELNSELAALESSCLDNLPSALAQLRADQLLSTAWLSGPRRLALFDELVREGSVVPAGGGQRASAPGAAGERLRSLRRSAFLLESQLIQFSDPDTARRFRALADPGSAGDEEVDAARLSQGVRELAIYYAGLPRAIANARTLAIVDPRDAMPVAADDFPLPAFKVELERAAELRLAPVATDLQLLEGKPATVAVTLRGTKRNLLDARITAENSESLLEFLGKSEQELPPERGWFGKRIEWQVRAKPTAVSERKARTRIAVTAEAGGGIRDSAAIDVDLPQPNRIDVQVTRIGSFVPGTPSQGDLQLSLFANRRSKFQLGLINQHDQPKTVNVMLYAVAERPNSPTPVGRFDNAIQRTVYDATSRVFLNAKLIAKSEQPVELPAADPDQLTKEPVFFTWVDPHAAAPPAAGAPASTTPPPPAAQPVLEPIHGLVLEITDAKDNSQVYPVKWIELEPLSPRDFLQIDIGYDQRRQQIVARLRPKNISPQGDPELPAGAPVQVAWDPSGARLPVEGIKNLVGEIDAATPRPEAILAAAAPADGQNRLVKIGVDGYPRAFRYRVSCRRDSTKPDYIPSLEDLEREETSIQIESVSVPSQNRVYHLLPDFQVPPPADPKAPPVEHIFLTTRPRPPALFRSPAETVIVHLQADAPIDAFRTETDRVQVTLRERSLAQAISRTLRTDREFKAVFVGAGARGVIELECTVGDLAVALPAGSLENAEPVIDADIRFQTNDDNDAVQLQLDGDPPRIETILVQPPFVKDGKATASLRVADYEGVGRVSFGFSKDGSRRLADADAKSLATGATRLDENRRHIVDFVVDLKDLPVGRQLLLVKVADHVGHESPVVGREILITDPAAMPLTGEIRGVLRYGPAEVNGSRFKMTIEGGDLGPTPVPIRPDGSFVISDLPIAEYTLKVLEGQFSGRSVPPKEQKGIKPADPRKPQPVTIDVSK